MKRVLAVLVVSWFALAGLAIAVEPDEILADPVLEQRARDVSAELRCLVCQNQSIDDSNADLARDLRLLVRERLVAGDSDEEVLEYVVDRYGEFVLLRPRLGLHTILLWGSAPLLFLVGLATLFLAMRRHKTAAEPEALTGEERKALDELLDNGRRR